MTPDSSTIHLNSDCEVGTTACFRDSALHPALHSFYYCHPSSSATSNSFIFTIILLDSKLHLPNVSVNPSGVGSGLILWVRVILWGFFRVIGVVDCVVEGNQCLGPSLCLSTTPQESFMVFTQSSIFTVPKPHAQAN